MPPPLQSSPGNEAQATTRVTQVLLEPYSLKRWAVAGMTIHYVNCFDLLPMPPPPPPGGPSAHFYWGGESRTEARRRPPRARPLPTCPAAATPPSVWMPHTVPASMLTSPSPLNVAGRCASSPLMVWQRRFSHTLCCSTFKDSYPPPPLNKKRPCIVSGGARELSLAVRSLGGVREPLRRGVSCTKGAGVTLDARALAAQDLPDAPALQLAHRAETPPDWPLFLEGR